MLSAGMLAVAIGVPVVFWSFWSDERGDNSELEDMATSYGDVSAVDSSCSSLLSALGWPYWYGRGSPSTPWNEGAAGVDCSGFAQMALVKLGRLSSSAGDRGATALANDSDALELGSQEPGDLACYPGHVAVVVSYPDSSGHSQVMSASGTRDTQGDNPAHVVKLQASGAYRSDFICYMRLRE